MARGSHVGQKRAIFARVGWMHFYNGSVLGDERPIGGGSYNKKKIGHEVYNFRDTDSQLYGYFQPVMSSHSIALERIDPDAEDEERLSRVLVIFVAPHPEGKQVVVGWYRDAEVFRNQIAQSPGKPKGFGHFCSAERHNCVLLPDENRRVEIPSGKGGFGQSNVCYALNADGTAKHEPWIERVLTFVDDYKANDILAEPEADAEDEGAAAAERALARSQGQGFARTPKERRALENHAMDAATKYFRDKGFRVKDVSKVRPYDLECKKGEREFHVEVKGTTTLGDAIVLTHGEVEHACNDRNECSLFVLHSIRLKRQKASGGEQFILEPWRLLRTNLRPINYTYRLR
jgi:hypothetical protein